MPITSYGVKGLIGHALGQYSPLTNRLASLAAVVASQLARGQSEILDFIGAIPAMQQLVGARQNATPIAHNYGIMLDKFESSIVLPRDWIDNDKTELVQRRVTEMALLRPLLYGQHVARLVNLGLATPAFDGANFFFAGARPFGGFNNVINPAAAIPAAPTPLEAANAIYGAYMRMISALDDQGKPCNENITSLAIVVPTNAVGAACGIAAASTTLAIAGNLVDNPVAAIRTGGIQLEVIASPSLTIANSFALVNKSPMAAPFAIVRNPDSLKVDVKADGSDFAFDQDAHAYGIMEVMASGYGLPTDAVLATFV
jgi:hypothetical protein